MAVVSVIPQFSRGVFAHHPDLYAILGSPVGANEDQINRCFRQVAKALRSGLVGRAQETDQASLIFTKVVSPARTLLNRPLERAEYDAKLVLTIKRVLEVQEQRTVMPTTVEALWLCQASELEPAYLRLVETLARDLYVNYNSTDTTVARVHQLSELNLAFLLLKYGGPYTPKAVAPPTAPTRAPQQSTAATPPPAASAPPPHPPAQDQFVAPETSTHPTHPLAGQLQQAEQLYQEALDWKARHHLRKAIQILGRAIAHAPHIPTYYLERARLSRQLNDLQTARSDYDQVILLEPNHSEALQGLRDILAGSSPSRPLYPTPKPDPHLQEAQRSYQAALAFVREKRYPDAISALDGAISKDPTNISYWLERARTLRWLQDLELARADYDQVVQLDPHNAEALQGLRDILIQSSPRPTPPAEPEPDPQAKQKQEAQLRHQQALHMIERGQLREALQYLTIAIDRDPQNLEYYLERARTQLKLKNPGMAHSDYKRVLQINPNHPEAQRGAIKTKPRTSQQPIPSPLLGREPKSDIERILFSDITHLLPKRKDKAPKSPSPDQGGNTP